MSKARQQSKARELKRNYDKHPLSPSNNKKRTRGRHVQVDPATGKVIRHYNV